MNQFDGFKQTLNKNYALFRHFLDVSGPKTFLNVAIWISAAAIGVVAVLYARLIGYVQGFYLAQFKNYPLVVSCLGPLLFIGATWIVKRYAPDAKGSGIPQVLSAIELSKSHRGDDQITWYNSLVSPRTAMFKVLSSCVGILGGASIGREGPTVQVASAGFTWVGNRLRRFAPHIEFQTFLIAGSAAGVAAAFNTPIAGITFAIEELSSDTFGAVRQVVMLAIIIGGIIAQGIGGDYLYFGHPHVVRVNEFLLLTEALSIGAVGGLMGGAFAKLLANPKLTRLPDDWVTRALIAGLICAILGYFTNGDTAGSGYEVTSTVLNNGKLDDVSVMFPFYKFATTTFSYLSGMAGGIFSPCLSIGAGVGLAIAKIASLPNFTTCALLGMVAFFSGAVRAPLTAVIIVMEMTDEHSLVLPFMIAAYLAYSAGNRVMPEPLYHYLSRKHLEG